MPCATTGIRASAPHDRWPAVCAVVETTIEPLCTVTFVGGKPFAAATPVCVPVTAIKASRRTTAQLNTRSMFTPLHLNQRLRGDGGILVVCQVRCQEKIAS